MEDILFLIFKLYMTVVIVLFVALIMSDVSQVKDKGSGSEEMVELSRWRQMYIKLRFAFGWPYYVFFIRFDNGGMYTKIGREE